MAVRLRILPVSLAEFIEYYIEKSPFLGEK